MNRIRAVVNRVAVMRSGSSVLVLPGRLKIALFNGLGASEMLETSPNLTGTLDTSRPFLITFFAHRKIVPTQNHDPNNAQNQAGTGRSPNYVRST
jgi:hypothetical protein